METATPTTYTAFAGDKAIAAGDLRTMLSGVMKRLGTGERLGARDLPTLLIFEDWSGRQVDFDLRGTAEEVLARAEAVRGVGESSAATRGRPRLGVVSREVSLLPRHWEWLEAQPNGMSAAIRRLVDEARKREPEKERARRALEAASRFMTAMAGDRVGFEEASRALFAGDRERLRGLIESWPADIRRQLERMLTV